MPLRRKGHGFARWVELAPLVCLDLPITCVVSNDVYRSVPCLPSFEYSAPRVADLPIGVNVSPAPPRFYQHAGLLAKLMLELPARVQRKDLPWWLIFRTTPYLSTILASNPGCAVFYSNVAMSRQRVLITDHFCTQIPTRAISRCFGLSWWQIL